MTRAALLAALLAVPAGAQTRVYKAELDRLAAQGYRQRSLAQATAAQGILRAAVFARADGSKRLYVTLEKAEGLKTLHMELGGAQDVALDAVHDGGAIPDLAGDGSRYVAFRLSAPRLEQETLVLMRWAGGVLEKVARVPGGRFEDAGGDSRLEVVSRERPLGQLFSVGCRESFHAMAQGAWRSDVWALRNGRYEKASESFKPFYDRRIADTRRQVAAIDARSTDDYGGFLGLTLGLYFDYAASGRAREGWREFERLYPVKASDPGPVKACLRQMEGALKSRLNIPDGW